MQKRKSWDTFKKKFSKKNWSYWQNHHPRHRAHPPRWTKLKASFQEIEQDRLTRSRHDWRPAVCRREDSQWTLPTACKASSHFAKVSPHCSPHHWPVSWYMFHGGEQKMADLPLCRITPDKPPFTYVWVECFVRFLTRHGRTEAKRYGLLYTCLVVRAVLIEVAHNLDINSFLNHFRLFVARRGSPELIRSDNGGNFVSGERELNRSIKEWNQGKIADFLLQRNVQWAFKPPCRSHHGVAQGQ